MVDPYLAMGVQSNIKSCFREPKSRLNKKVIKENLTRALELVEGRKGWWGAPKLIVFPEFFIQGLAMDRPIKDWVAMSLRVPGEETDVIAAAAKRLGSYISACVYEYDPNFPKRYWDTSFIIDPRGKIILKYRQHYGGLFCGYSVPNDVLTEFIKRYGKNSLFPVVDTPIGKLGALICFDTNFPEVARCLALNGAEVMIHSTGEPRGWYREYWELAKRSRAYENVAYLISVNRGNWIDTILPVDESQGRSMVVDYTGRIVAVAETGNEAIVRGEINIEALRQRRQNPLWNFIGHLQNGLHAESYKREIWPSDHFAKKAPEDADDYAELQAKIMDLMIKHGVVKKPAVKRKVTPTTVS